MIRAGRTAGRLAPAVAVAWAAWAAWAACAACAAACGAGAPDGPTDAGMDAGLPCSTFLELDALDPVASPFTVIRATAGVLDAPGVLLHAWSVRFEDGSPVAHAPAQADGSAITFPAAQPGVYHVRLDVGAAVSCPTAQVQLNVRAPGAIPAEARLRVTPPASSGVPPFETRLVVWGGANATVGTHALDPGVPAAAIVESGGAGVAAYVRLMPISARDAAVEAFAGAGGGFVARVQAQEHDVLVIPTAPGYAPRRSGMWFPPNTAITVGPGIAVTGTVRGPGGGPLLGAKVQLKIGDVPSTLATTAAGGAFSVRAEPGLGAIIEVDVAPPAGSGLPRLLARSAAFDLGQPFQIDYGALALRDLVGATIRRQAAPVAGAKVVLVGELPAIGTVAAGGAPVSADGVVRIAATANASGVLPATLAPARPLSAVVEVAPGDHAVAAIDLTSGTPAAIDAPPATAVATELRRPDGAPIGEAVLDAVPAGALALAGVTSTIRARSDAAGQLQASLAAGGRYELRVHDPVLARGAPRIVPDVAAPLAASYALGPALTLTGQLVLKGIPTPVRGAAVQLLCSPCSGLERSRPLAEGTSRPDGTFSLAAPDPGTN